MKYIVEDNDGKKMIMEVVSSIPRLPDGWSILGEADLLPEAIVEIQNAVDIEVAALTARQFLANTDWQVTRHRDQLDAGIATNLTAEEFTQLLTQRQTARDAI